MKQILAIALLVFITSPSLLAQHIGNGGRPYKKGRVLFGTQEAHDNKKALEVYGKVWRTGADAATVITVKKDCVFGDKPLKAGTYTLFTIPGPDQWTIIINSKLGQWGAYSYDKNKDSDVLQTTVKAGHTKASVEQFTITLPDGGIKMEWDMVSVFVPVK